MRWCAIALGLPVIGLCLAADDEPTKVPPGLENARKEYKAALGKAQAEYNRSVTNAAEEHKKRLKDLQQAETKAGNLDAALAARDELRALEMNGPPLLAEGKDPAVAKGKWVTGTWIIRHHPNGSIRTYVIRSDGQVTFLEGHVKGQLKRSGESFTLDFGEGKFERITFAGGRLFVEHYNPKSDFEKNLPGQIGVGVLKKR
jgi:hypothetical protein